MPKQLNKQDSSLKPSKDYANFLNDIKDRLKSAQIRAALAANSELIKFYYHLGTDLIEKQATYSWGDHFLAQFSEEMRVLFHRLLEAPSSRHKYNITMPGLIIICWCFLLHKRFFSNKIHTRKNHMAKTISRTRN